MFTEFTDKFYILCISSFLSSVLEQRKLVHLISVFLFASIKLSSTRLNWIPVQTVCSRSDFNK